MPETTEKPFIIRNSFNKNTQVKYKVYHEFINNIGVSEVCEIGQLLVPLLPLSALITIYAYLCL